MAASKFANPCADAGVAKRAETAAAIAPVVNARREICMENPPAA